MHILAGPEVCGGVDYLEGDGEAGCGCAEVAGHAQQALPLCGCPISHQAGQCGDGHGDVYGGGGRWRTYTLST